MNIRESNLQIIEHLAKGLTRKEIANVMAMPKRTVDSRIEGMKKEYHCTTLSQLTLKVMLSNLVHFAGKEA